MLTHAQIDEWYEQWFGGRRDANSQNAIAVLHGLLGTERLEDKTTGGDMKKLTQGDEDVTV